MDTPVGEVASSTERKLHSRILRLFLLLLVSVIALTLLFLSSWLVGGEQARGLFQLSCFAVGVSCLVVAIVYLRVSFFVPLEHLTTWAMRRGHVDLSKGLPGTPDVSLHMVARRIAILNEEMRNMRDLLDDDEYNQTRVLAQKSRSLQVLYDVAASVNIFNDLDDLLTRFLHTLADVVKAQAASVRLLDPDGTRCGWLPALV